MSHRNFGAGVLSPARRGPWGGADGRPAWWSRGSVGPASCCALGKVVTVEMATLLWSFLSSHSVFAMVRVALSSLWSLWRWCCGAPAVDVWSGGCMNRSFFWASVMCSLSGGFVSSWLICLKLLDHVVLRRISLSPACWSCWIQGVDFPSAMIPADYPLVSSAPGGRSGGGGGGAPASRVGVYGDLVPQGPVCNFLSFLGVLYHCLCAI